MDQAYQDDHLTILSSILLLNLDIMSHTDSFLENLYICSDNALCASCLNSGYIQVNTSMVYLNVMEYQKNRWHD